MSESGLVYPHDLGHVLELPGVGIVCQFRRGCQNSGGGRPRWRRGRPRGRRWRRRRRRRVRRPRIGVGRVVVVVVAAAADVIVTPHVHTIVDTVVARAAVGIAAVVPSPICPARPICPLEVVTLPGGPVTVPAGSEFSPRVVAIFAGFRRGNSATWTLTCGVCPKEHIRALGVPGLQ